MRRNCRCEFVVELPGAVTVDAITLTIEGTNEWQVEYVTVYKLNDLEQRRGERTDSGDGTAHIYWRRDFDESGKVANVRQSVLLYANTTALVPFSNTSWK